MKRILTSSEMFLCDRTEIETNTPSRVLMERAARACADEILRILGDTAGSGVVPILCGGGNNGGDGILCARLLREHGIDAVICPSFSADDRLSEECCFRWREAIAAGVPVIAAEEFLAANYDAAKEPDAAQSVAQTAADHASPHRYRMIVDALFGIGLTREISGISADLIDAANAIAARDRIPTAAIDIASGIFADTGKVSAHTFRATHTLAINHAKRGHFLYPGATYTGALSVLAIGIPDAPLYARADDFPVRMLDDDDVRELLPPRREDSNKGTNGRILVAAGSVNMCGAAYLSALAAYRCGAGLVEIFTCAENRIPLQTLLPEAILTTCDCADADGAADSLRQSLSRASAVVIGPGLGTSAIAARLVETVLLYARVPTVVDADGLNLLAAGSVGIGWQEGADLPPLIFTPHPGELSRLTGLSVGACLDDLFTTAKTYAAANHVVLNAKNTRSVITDGVRAYLNPTGTSALAKGGSGDVLSGITATLAAQGCDPLTAAALAAYLHGRAAEHLTRRMGARSPLASEIADALGEVFEEIAE